MTRHIMISSNCRRCGRRRRRGRRCHLVRYDLSQGHSAHRPRIQSRPPRRAVLLRVGNALRGQRMIEAPRVNTLMTGHAALPFEALAAIRTRVGLLAGV